MSFTARLEIYAQARSVPVEGLKHNGELRNRADITEGTDAGEADKCYRKDVTVAFNSTPKTYNLSDASEEDIDGDGIAWRELVGYVIYNQSDTYQLNVSFDFGGAGSTWTQPIPPLTRIAWDGTAYANGYTIAGADAPHITLDFEGGANQIASVWLLGRTLS
jgi:hypothetical protein